MTNPNDPFHYERDQLERLGEHKHYLLKIKSATGETKWLSLDAEQFLAVFDAVIGPGGNVTERTGSVL